MKARKNPLLEWARGEVMEEIADLLYDAPMSRVRDTLAAARGARIHDNEAYRSLWVLGLVTKRLPAIRASAHPETLVRELVLVCDLRRVNVTAADLAFVSRGRAPSPRAVAAWLLERERSLGPKPAALERKRHAIRQAEGRARRRDVEKD